MQYSECVVAKQEFLQANSDIIPYSLTSLFTLLITFYIIVQNLLYKIFFAHSYREQSFGNISLKKGM